MLHLKTAILNAEAENNTRLVGIRRAVNELKGGGKRRSRSHRLDSAIDEYRFTKPRVCVDVNFNDEDWFVQLIKACVNKRKILVQLSGDKIGYFNVNISHPRSGRELFDLGDDYDEYFSSAGEDWLRLLKKHNGGWIYFDHDFFRPRVKFGEERFWFQLGVGDNAEDYSFIITDTRIKDIRSVKKWASTLRSGDVRFTTQSTQSALFKIPSTKEALIAYLENHLVSFYNSS